MNIEQRSRLEGRHTLEAVEHAGRFVAELLSATLRPDLLLNVNLPAGELQGLSFTRLGKRVYQQVVFEVAGATRTELSRSAPTPVRALLLRQETVYDSVIDLHDFVTKNMGLPLVFDTSSGLAVWNYPVDHVRIDRLGEVERAEAGVGFTYTRYRLRYRTMGGPTGDAHYIIKRDLAGNAVRAVAEDPMPDFAFRNEHWVCAPAAADDRGTPAYNAAALEGGYLLDKGGTKVVAGLWRRLATLVYASLSAGPGAEPVRLFETRAGELRRFDDAASFQAAIAADRPPPVA